METSGFRQVSITQSWTWMKSTITSKTSDLPLVRDDFSRLRTEYDIADKVMKDVQAFVEEAGIPAINELRYAGYHLLNAISPLDADSSSSDELMRALNHCKRATYEASEAGLLTAFGKISEFKADYQQVVVSSVVQDWTEILAKCDTYRDRITEARQTGDDRSIDHTKFRDAFLDLVAVCRRLDHARDELNKQIEQKQVDARRFIVTTVLAGLGVVLAIGAIVVTVLVS
jgi:hypothetical protein